MPGSTTRLLLAARQLARQPVLEARQVDQRQRGGDLLACRVGRNLAQLEAEHDVLVHGLVRPHRVVLKHHAHAAMLGQHHAVGRGHQPVADVDCAGVGPHVAGDQAQGRGLAAAARAEQRHERVVADDQVEIADGGSLGAVALRQTLDGDARHSSTLERDDFSSNRHHALAFCLSMIFSENRWPLFGIMLYATFSPSGRSPPSLRAIQIAAAMMTTLMIARAATGSV
jgi:hypothetical protein